MRQKSLIMSLTFMVHVQSVCVVSIACTYSDNAPMFFFCCSPAFDSALKRIRCISLSLIPAPITLAARSGTMVASTEPFSSTSACRNTFAITASYNTSVKGDVYCKALVMVASLTVILGLGENCSAVHGRPMALIPSQARSRLEAQGFSSSGYGTGWGLTGCM